MDTVWLCVFGVFIVITDARNRCSNAGGVCQLDHLPCSGGYRTGLCPGGVSNRCCMPASGNRCSSAGGVCQLDHLPCSGRYRTGLCPGGVNNRCCMPASTAISSSCLACICEVESNCQPLNCAMDAGSLSCGYYQIKSDYYKDCGRPGSGWKSCAKDKTCADTCVTTYLNRYGTYCTRGRTPTCQDYARIHNGGPKGCRYSSTLGYWNKVNACLGRGKK